MKLRRDLSISQKSAWHLAHRLRKAWEEDGSLFAGPVEADECYVGGKRRNMPLAKRKELDGRGPVGKVAVVGIKDRPTKLVRAKVVSNTDSETLQGFLRDSVNAGAKVYTDDAPVYDNMPGFEHESVKHLGCRVCARDGAHKRRGEFLVDAQEGAQGHLPQSQCQASPTVRQRVRRPPQSTGVRHAGPNAGNGARDGPEAVEVRRLGGVKRCPQKLR